MSDLDDINPVAYVQSTLHAEVILSELGFKRYGEGNAGHLGQGDPSEFWVKRLRKGIVLSVIVNKKTGLVNYRKVRLHDTSRLLPGSEFTVLTHRMDVPVSEVRREVLGWEHPEVQETIYQLLDADIDAFDPRADLDRLMPHRCPGCGGSNISSEPDDENLIDCFDCGIWFDPFHPDNSPSVPSNYPDPALWKDRPPRLESADVDSPEAFLKDYNRRYYKLFAGGAFIDVFSSIEAALERARERRLAAKRRVWIEAEETPDAPEGVIAGSQPVGVVYDVTRNYQAILRRTNESLEDEISDLKAYAMAHGLPPRVTITYSRTTPESVEQGDFSESGWEDEEGVVMALDEYDEEEGLTVADITAKYLKDEGCYDTSSSVFHPGMWYTTEWSTIDYATGEQEERNFHLVGFTEEQEKAVWDKFHEPRRPVVWQ